MKRREFLARSAAAGAGLGLAAAWSWPLRALADGCEVVDLPRTLVNVMLQGGADFRFLFMPSPAHPSPGYLDAIWSARRALYDGAYADYQQMFDNEYLAVTDPRSGLPFGIHNSAGWLASEFQAGRVAIVANAYCSRNRRHDQSILNADAGEPDLAQLQFDRDGWGGRLAEQLAGAPNVVELGSSVSVFGKGSLPGQRLARVVHAEDMRDLALAGTDQGPAVSRRNVMARALHAWYEARGAEVPAEHAPDWPYHTFFQHRDALQAFGQAVGERLAPCGELPPELAALQLSNAGFAQQCRNLYDACLVPDVLNLRVMSMSYGGWDTHDNQHAEITGNLADLLGSGGGLATALAAVEDLPWLEVPAREQLVFYFASDFGRQLRANGTAGTDHGRGTYAVLLGSRVNGGVLGEMFPEAEARAGEGGGVPLATQGADIEGRTSTERVLASACDWMQPGTGALVFPGAAASGLEAGVDTDSLIG